MSVPSARAIRSPPGGRNPAFWMSSVLRRVTTESTPLPCSTAPRTPPSGRADGERPHLFRRRHHRPRGDLGSRGVPLVHPPPRAAAAVAALGPPPRRHLPSPGAAGTPDQSPHH